MLGELLYALADLLITFWPWPAAEHEQRRAETPDTSSVPSVPRRD